MTHRVTHLGLCVRDLDRSVAFYERALGFTEIGRMEVDNAETETLLGTTGALDLVYLERDGWRIELLGYAAGAVGDGSPRPMQQLGFTHVSVRVSSLDDLVGPIEAHGGQVLQESLITFEWGNRGVMALDPDGTRIELIEGRPA